MERLNSTHQHADDDAEATAMTPQPLAKAGNRNTGSDTLPISPQIARQQKHQQRQRVKCSNSPRRHNVTHCSNDCQQDPDHYAHHHRTESAASRRHHCHSHSFDNTHPRMNRRHFSYTRVGVIHPKYKVQPGTERNKDTVLDSGNNGPSPSSSSPTQRAAPLPSTATTAGASTPSPSLQDSPGVTYNTSPLGNSNSMYSTNEWKVDNRSQEDNENGKDRRVRSKVVVTRAEDMIMKRNNKKSSKQDPNQQLQLPQTDPLHSDHFDSTHDEPECEERPRMSKLLAKHSSVKLDWRVPEPIKAGGETLRGVLIINAKESDLKTAMTKHKKSKKCMVQIEHIQVHLTGFEGKGAFCTKEGREERKVRRGKVEMSKGMAKLTMHAPFCDCTLLTLLEIANGGLVSRTIARCFLQETKVLSVEDLRSLSCTPLSSLTSPPSAPSVAHPHNSFLAAPTLPSASCVPNSPPTSTVPESFQPGCLPPGTQQVIPFQMKVPDKVGGTFKSAYAGIRFQLTAYALCRFPVVQSPLFAHCEC